MTQSYMDVSKFIFILVYLAVVNIFAGFDQQAISVPFSAKIVIWVALGWIGLIELTSYIYDCMHKKGRLVSSSRI